MAAKATISAPLIINSFDLRSYSLCYTLFAESIYLKITYNGKKREYTKVKFCYLLLHLTNTCSAKNEGFEMMDQKSCFSPCMEPFYFKRTNPVPFSAALRTSLKNEAGQGMVLFALVLIVLIGFGALTLDIGRISVEKSKLQNAVDAAALAAVQDLPDKAAAGNTAEECARNNGIIAPVDITFSDSDRKISVKATQPVEYTLAKVLGFDRTTVSVQAAATLTDVFHSFHYALFSGSNIDLLTLTGQNEITGDVHSNDSIVIDGQTDVNGAVTAVGSIDNSGLTATTVKTAWKNIAMPNFSGILSKAYTYTDGYHDLTLSSDQLNTLLNENSTVYYDGNLVIDGSGITAPGCLIVSGDITFHGSNVNMTSAAPVCLCSLSGNITLDGGGEDIYGVIYAPNGTVTLDGKSDRMYGSIIGNEINSNGGLNITYNGGVSAVCVPDTVRRLSE